MERSKVVINIAKITQINRTLNYLLECSKDEEIDYPTHLHPELNHIDDWAFEIQAYWRECKDPIIAEQIANIGSSGNFYKLLLCARMADDIRGAISRYVNVMGELRAEIKQHQEQSKGAYSMLPDELANDEAAMLLQRAVEAGYLKEDYQPGTHTSNAQLRFLAFGIGTALHLKHKWEPFERLWNKEKLPGVYIPSSKIVDFEDIIKLYNEVDFSGISADQNIAKAINKLKENNTIVDEDKIEDPERTHYHSSTEDKELLKIFVKLKQHKYITEDTTGEQWLYMCTGKDSLKEHCAPIKWNKQQRLLVFLIDRMFGESDEFRRWIIATDAFRISKADGYIKQKHDNYRRAAQDVLNDTPTRSIKAFEDKIFTK